jgi:hypothetical protein
MAIDFFSEFPKIGYSLDDNATQQVVVDILKRVIIQKEYQENAAYYEEYDIKHGETPEEVSFRFYGTTTLHWLILMVNNIIDPRFEWPMSEENLIKQVESKYGGENNIFTLNRAKNAKGYQVETFFILSEESTHKDQVRILYEGISDNINTPVIYQDSLTIAEYESNYEVESQKNEKIRSIKIIKPEIVQDIAINYKQLISK